MKIPPRSLSCARQAQGNQACPQTGGLGFNPAAAPNSLLQHLLQASHARVTARPTGRHRGLLRSELLALQWAHIDFERLEIPPAPYSTGRQARFRPCTTKPCYFGRSIRPPSGTGVKMPSNLSTSGSRPTILDSSSYTPSRGISLRTKMVSWVGSDSHSMVSVVTG